MKRRRRKQIDPGQAAAKLRDLSWRIRGMAYLLECHGNNPCPPLDELEIYFGIGGILSELGRRVYRVAHALDEAEIEAARVRQENGDA